MKMMKARLIGGFERGSNACIPQDIPPLADDLICSIENNRHRQGK